MISADMVSTDLGVQVIKNPQMEICVQKWSNMYKNTASWNNGRIISLSLASAISREFSRLVLAETEITADGDRYISEQFKKLSSKLSVAIEQACAMGGIIVKPYLSNGNIFIDLIRADCFLPVAFTEKTMTAAVFVSKKTVGNVYFTLLEYHEFNAENQTHTIKNKVCKSLNSEYIGMECSFDEVPEWSGLVSEITFRNVENRCFRISECLMQTILTLIHRSEFQSMRGLLTLSVRLMNSGRELSGNTNQRKPLLM